MFIVDNEYWDAERASFEDEVDAFRRRYEATRILRDEPVSPVVRRALDAELPAKELVAA